MTAKSWGRVLGWMGLIVVVSCDPTRSSVKMPERGTDLSGPVSPAPMHDLVSQHREELGLSEKEDQAIRQIADDAREELDGYHDAVRKERAQLSALLSKERPDREAINRSIDALGVVETRLRRGEIRVLLDIRDRLTPEQRSALVSWSQGSKGPREGG